MMSGIWGKKKDRPKGVEDACSSWDGRDLHYFIKGCHTDWVMLSMM